MTVDTEALIAAVRAGDIEAAQALLPVDPIVKRAREICARHMGTPATYIAGKMDGWPAMGAVTEALRGTTISDEQITQAARAALYAMTIHETYKHLDYVNASDFLTNGADQTAVFRCVWSAIHAALLAA